MSFLVDPPLLVGTGALIERKVKNRTGATLVEAEVLATFLAVSISLYQNRRWIHWLARLCRAKDGRDWMLNSGVFHFDPDSAGPGTHAVSALIFCTYPLWIHLGRRLARR